MRARASADAGVQRAPAVQVPMPCDTPLTAWTPFALRPARAARSWVNSTTMPGFQWLGDTSSEEVAAHLFAYPLALDVLAGANASAAAAAREALIAITDHILAHGYLLVDPATDQPTRWGFWSPYLLNDVCVRPLPRRGERTQPCAPSCDLWPHAKRVHALVPPRREDNYSERDLNSLGMLAFLASAYSVSGNATYIQQFEELLAPPNGYGLNMVNMKIATVRARGNAHRCLLTAMRTARR